MPSPQRKRLDSWKAIAEYLGRNVRTVTRWAEQRSLPVHRVPGGKRQSVFAYSDEIDAWLLNQNSTEPDQLVSKLATEPNPDDTRLNSKPPRKTARTLLKFAWVAVAIATVAAGTAWIVKNLVEGRTRAAASVPLQFVQLTNDGRAKEFFRADGGTLYFDELANRGRLVYSVPATGGQPREVNIPVPNPTVQDISQDGQHLLIASSEGIELERTLWVVPSSGGTARRLGDLTCESARWSLDDQRIACVNGTSILVANADGSSVRTLASLPSTPSKLAWTPSGRRLIFVLENSNDSAASSAWALDVGSDAQNRRESPVALPWGKDCCLDWTWVDAGKRFLYLREREDGSAVIGQIRTGDGSLDRPIERAELPVNIGRVESFGANDQNNRIYLAIVGRLRGEVLKMGPTGTPYQLILPGITADEISYSRDGRWIAYVNISDFTLWRSRSDGSDSLQLIKPPWQGELPAWSPDGLTIAYTAKAPGKPWRIFLVGKNGTGRREAVPGGDDNQGAPSWSPDGGTLVYGNVLCQPTQTCWIHELDLRTGAVRVLPGSHGLRTARFSPNGRYVAALQPEKHEVVLFDTKSQTWRVLADSVTGDNINWSADSRFIFADSPRIEHPIIEKIRVSDGHRAIVADLTPIERMPGLDSAWFGLAPDGSPILLHYYNSSEIYALNWNFH